MAFSLIYVLVFAFRVEPSIEEGRGAYWSAALFGLAAAAVMLLVLTAQANVVAQSLGGGWLWTVLAFAVLALLFLPVRQLYLSRTTGLRAPVGYAATASLVLLLAVLVAQWG